MAGFSLVEVMVGCAILATGIFFVLGNSMNVTNLRVSTEESRRAAMIAENIVTAIQATPWDDLNDRGKPGAWLSWTRRVDPEDNGMADDSEWLGDLDSLRYDGTAMIDPAGNTPQTRRMLPDRVADDGTIVPLASGLRGLRVYVEYYRAISSTDEDGAVIKGPDNLPAWGGMIQGLYERIAGDPIGNRILIRTSEDANGNGALDSTTEDLNGNGVLDPGEDTNGNGLLDTTTSEDRDGNGLINAIDATSAQTLMNPNGPVLQYAGINRLQHYMTQNGTSDLLMPNNQTISSQVGSRLGPNDPVAVRILVTWHDSNIALPTNTTSRIDFESRVHRMCYQAITLRRH